MLRALTLTAAGFIVLTLVAAGVGYAMIKVPEPKDVQISQTSLIYYSDGKTVLARVGAANRTDVSINQVPKSMQYAVVAAENRSFFTDPGVSFKGIGRAVWADVHRGGVQGGSTITQQYAKNAFLSQDRTITRKVRELGISIKLGRKYSKSQILEWYLNTVYYGRGAYGVQAAAQTYFGVNSAKLTLAQSAVLASSIRSPALYDPAQHRARAVARWHYVLDGMQSQGWLDRRDNESAKFPKMQPISDSDLNDLSGPKGYVVGQVERELAQQGISEDQLRRSGLRVTTTVDKRAQDAAVSAVSTAMDGEPKSLRTALAAVDPRTGAVRAYYGGKKGYGYLDYAAQDYQSGSSIKAFVLATALKQGISLNSTWDGSSPQTFPDRPKKPIYNSGDARGEQCPQCSLWRATAESLNTVYYALTAKVGVAKAAELADAAGIHTLNGSPTTEMAPKLTNDFGIGEYEVNPLEMADGFATFGAAGVQRDPYFVSKVIRPGGDALYTHSSSAPVRAFSSTVAGDADWALQKVITQEGRGGSRDRRLSGPNGQYRPAGAKTGTTQLTAGRADLANKDAWFAGYTPQLATAVWLGHDTATPLRDARGRDIYGIGLPGQVWHDFTEAALAGQPVQDFPAATFSGRDSAQSSNSGSNSGNSSGSGSDTGGSSGQQGTGDNGTSSGSSPNRNDPNRNDQSSPPPSEQVPSLDPSTSPTADPPAPTLTFDPPSTGQSPPGQGIPGQNPPGQNPPGQNPPGQNPPGQGQGGQNPPGQGQGGQNPPGQNQPGQGVLGGGQPGQDRGNVKSGDLRPGSLQPGSFQPRGSGPVTSSPGSTDGGDRPQGVSRDVAPAAPARGGAKLPPGGRVAVPALGSR